MAIPAPAPHNAPIRVMVVEDSIMMRSAIRKILGDDPEIDLAATANNGQEALDKLANQNFDVVILDIEMPIMDGLTALPKIVKVSPGIQVIISSALTMKGAAISLEALSLGAADYITKPNAAMGADVFGQYLKAKIKSLGRAAIARKQQKKQFVGSPRLVSIQKSFQAQCLAIGSSTGGPQALPILLRALGPQTSYPIFITQHMPPAFTAILAEHLEQASGMPTREGKDGEEVAPGRIYVAPGNFHMLIEQKSGNRVIRLSQDAPENFCRPAVDPMLRSLANTYKGKVLTVILTGMGHDGTAGMKILSEQGGLAIAQDEQSSVVWGMPGALVQAGLASAILPLQNIAAQAQKYLPGGRP